MRLSAKISQKQLAKSMGVLQANISKVENSNNIQLSTLQCYISVLGDKISITAQMPNGEFVVMAQFSLPNNSLIDYFLFDNLK